jgi:MFS family permease
MTTVTEPQTITRTRRAPLYALLVANTVSFVGDILAFLAIPWFVLQSTGSVTRTGVTAFCSAAAVATSALFGSKLVDWLGYKHASVLSDAVSGVCIAAIPLLYQLGMLAFWELLALVFLVGLVATPGQTARSAYLPDLAQLAGLRLERVTAAADGTRRISGFIGAPLAGVLIVLTGTSNLLWIDAATFAVSAVLIGLVVSTPAPSHEPALPNEEAAVPEASAPMGRFFGDVSMGVRFLWRDRVLRGIVVTVMVTNLLDAGFGAVLAPAYIRQAYGSAIVLGGIVAAFGGGAFLGTLIFGAVGHRLPRRWALRVGFSLAAPTRWFALALIPFAPVLIAVNAVAGVFIGPVNPLIGTLEFERIPRALRARVLGTITAGANVGMPLGGLLAGFCGVALGVRTSLLVFGGCYLIATASLLVNPALRAMDAARAPAGAS